MKKGDLLAVKVLAVQGRRIRGELLNYDLQTCKLLIDDDPQPSAKRMCEIKAECMRIVTKKGTHRLRPSTRRKHSVYPEVTIGTDTDLRLISVKNHTEDQIENCLNSIARERHPKTR